jgi:[protein-PII] uridylyltransferase
MSLPERKPPTPPRDPLLEQLSSRKLSGPEYASRRAATIDEKLIQLFGDPPDMCLMPLGGYGRAELCPHSDIDLMILTEGAGPTQEIEKFLYALWDQGLKVGHSVRTKNECLDLALKDSKILTSLIDARAIVGNIAAGEAMRKEIALLLSPRQKKAFVQSKLTERDERHARYGDTRYVLEPNIKEGKGGLRDFQTLLWITKVLYGARTLGDLVDINILTQSEATRFAKSHDFLLTVRCHLHQIAGRAEERLHFDIQPDLAERLGYTSRHTGKSVERFMKHYFLVTRDMGDLTRILLAAIEHEEHAHAKSENFSGFETLDDRLTTGGKLDLKAHPIDMLRLFQVAQQTGKSIHPFALKDITRHLKYIDDSMREDDSANRIFLEILTAKKDAALTLRRMNESGVLGRFIPDFGRIIALMQFDRYHHFTVDEHTIRCIDLMHKMESGLLRDEAPLASDAAQNISSRIPLFVALFLHDICKGRGGRHAELGGELALSLCPRFGLDGEDTDLVSWLVHEHLLMSDTAFRRNLNNPKTIADFSARIRNLKRLDLLFCLTTADIMGVGPGRWTAWKARLLEELYLKTRALMQGEEPGIMTELTLPDSYIAGETRIDIFTDNDQSATVVLVYTPDRPGLFATLCGAMSAEGASIMRAYINTLPNDTKAGKIAADRFIIQNATGLPFLQHRRQEDLRHTIRQAIESTLDIDSKIAEHRIPLSKKDLVFDIPPKIRIDNTASGGDTVIEIETRDRHGLLYDIACTLRDEGLDIRAAKINTQGLRAIDAFYIQTSKRKKLTDSAGQERLIALLKAKVAKP